MKIILDINYVYAIHKRSYGVLIKYKDSWIALDIPYDEIINYLKENQWL